MLSQVDMFVYDALFGGNFKLSRITFQQTVEDVGGEVEGVLTHSGDTTVSGEIDGGSNTRWRYHCQWRGRG